jgi:uncharacterized membrane protein YfcA
MVPLFAVLFGPVEAIAITTPVMSIGTLPLYPDAMRSARWPELLPISLALVVFIPVGVFVLFSLEPVLIRRAMGFVVILAGLSLLSGWVYRGPRGALPSATAGAVAGVLAGAVGLGGPAIAVYSLASPQPPQVQRANIVISVGVLIVVTIAMFAYVGGITADTLKRAAALTPFYLLASWAGNRLFALAPKDYFKRVAAWLLLATGAAVALL